MAFLTHKNIILRLGKPRYLAQNLVPSSIFPLAASIPSQAFAFRSSHSLNSPKKSFCTKRNIILLNSPGKKNLKVYTRNFHFFIENSPLRMSTMAAMAMQSTNDEVLTETPGVTDAEMARFSYMLQTSIETSFSDKEDGAIIDTAIEQAIDLLRHLDCQAKSFRFEESNDGILPGNFDDEGHNTQFSNFSSMKSESFDPNPDRACQLDILATSATCACHSLHRLVQRAKSSKSPSTRSKSGVYAWKALQSVVSSTFEVDYLPSSSVEKNPDTTNSSKIQKLSRALAWLAIGATLTGDSLKEYTSNFPSGKKGSSQSITKTVASAVLPDHLVHVLRGSSEVNSKNKKDLMQDAKYSKEVREERIIYSVARNIVIEILLSVDANFNGQNEEMVINLQVAAKLASGFGVGDQSAAMANDAKEEELAKTLANVVNCVFGWKNVIDESNCNSGMKGFGTGTENTNKDAAAPALALVAHIRPWKFVKPGALVTASAEMDLWCSAELICDATIDSVTDEMKMLIPLAKDPDARAPDSIAHIATGAIIDIAFDYRLYRRADAFATKYYSFGGPERFAEARFLHACDTIAKLVKKKQSQIIEKQVERVDESVQRVIKDLALASGGDGGKENGGEGIPIETMNKHVREFSLRRLREGNMLTAAVRLAGLWGMEYEHDPEQLIQEAKRRKLTYLQWDDEGCPGSTSDTDEANSVLAPSLISDPAELLHQFSLLENDSERTIGFDCEWGDAMRGVALLQLSNLTLSLLLDIPALTSTTEGCNALRATVGKLFSGSTKVQNVIGFGCKEDFTRLRASSIGPDHWFPQKERLFAKDLRSIIAETNPELGGRGGMHVGLSRACEHFLGKQLDKAEQCSDWSTRPLSPEQREYAALDAWSCTAIYKKIAEVYDIHGMYIR